MQAEARALVLSAAALTVGLWTGTAGADAADDRAALHGLREVKVAFDIKEGDAKRMLMGLNVIDETRQSLIRQGVTPRIVLAFRGPATRLVQTDIEKIKPEARETAQKIAAKLRELRAAAGVESMEQCSVAVRLQETKPENVLPEIKVVRNSWISLMAYQAKGYVYERHGGASDGCDVARYRMTGRDSEIARSMRRGCVQT